MVRFVELKVEEAGETKMQMVNTDCIGRIYPDPQNNRKSIVELNYQSINDAPVFLEVGMPYETLRSYFIS